MQAPYRSWVEISRRRLAANYRALAAAVGSGVELVPVVKADAYHHGAVEVARVLVAEGARWLAVSSVEEGLELRQAGFETRILVMADFLRQELEALFDYDLTPVVHSLEKIHSLETAAARRNRRFPVHLKLDTGMSRLGVAAPAEEIVAAVRRAPHLDWEGLMTHLAAAADFSSSQTEQQEQRFETLAFQLHEAGIHPRYRHISASAPVAYRRRRLWKNMVRPGLALYGYVPPASGQEAPAPALPVEPVLEWKAALVETKEIPAGARVGYDALFQAPEPMRLGILAVGYADGLPHQLSNRGQVIAAGRLVHILGAISMDLTAIDLTHVPELSTGDAVTLLGTQGGVRLDARQMAAVAGTIPYSILCGLTARVHRVYI